MLIGRTFLANLTNRGRLGAGLQMRYLRHNSTNSKEWAAYLLPPLVNLFIRDNLSKVARRVH